jgi:hypothetical protein
MYRKYTCNTHLNNRSKWRNRNAKLSMAVVNYIYYRRVQ